MKSDSLLSELFAEDADLRTATLQQVRTLARCRRRNRAVRRTLCTAAILAAAACLLNPQWFGRRAPQPHMALQIVRTTPLAAAQPISTQPGLFRPIQNSTANIAMVSDGRTGCRIVSTRSAAAELDILTDKELLAALSDHHPILVGAGTGEAQLILR